ncbi:MAG: hypothetical protein PHC75_07810 [Burkholderiales bacterium]|nr:hypothetical protein [Burkholderiales bacterium]
MRYNMICNLAPNDQESLYKKLANQVSNENLSTCALKSEFQAFYPNCKEHSTLQKFKS